MKRSGAGESANKLTGRVHCRRAFLRQAGQLGLATGFIGLRSLVGATPARSAVKASGNLTVAYRGTAEQQKAWNALFEVFRQEHPDVNVTAIGLAAADWAGFFDTVSVQIAGGRIPDVLQVPTEGQRLFASRGLVEPIDAYLERDKAELADFFADVHPNLIKWNDTLSSPDGKKYYLPGPFNTMCVWYNAELFQRAGLTEPADDWTWDEFLAVAEKLIKPGEVYGMYVPAAYFVGIMPWLLTNGASTMNATWTEATVDTPQAIEAVTFMRSLVEKGISPRPGGTFDPFTATAQGRLAMFGHGRLPLVSMRNLHFVDKMRIVAWPHKLRKGTPVGWQGYPIMRASRNKEAAWAFVKFIVSRKASEYFARFGITVTPPRRSVVMSQAYLADSPKGSEKWYQALDYATPIPAPNKGNIIETAIIDTLSQALTGNVEVARALKDLNQKIRANL